MQTEKKNTENTEDTICVIFFKLVWFEILKIVLPNIQVSCVIMTCQVVDTA
jgi:hypothetical protein